MNQFGFVRITCVSPRTAVANPSANAAEIVRVLDSVPESDVVVFPELCLTGYTCGDLFHQQALLDGANDALTQVIDASETVFPGIAILGPHVEAGRALEEADRAMYVRKVQRRHEA